MKREEKRRGHWVGEVGLARHASGGLLEVEQEGRKGG